MLYLTYSTNSILNINQTCHIAQLITKANEGFKQNFT